MRSYQVDRQRKEEKRVFEEVLTGGQEVDLWKTERTAEGKLPRLTEHPNCNLIIVLFGIRTFMNIHILTLHLCKALYSLLNAYALYDSFISIVTRLQETFEAARYRRRAGQIT